jgi:predicted DsbA family dithiol-disulfide isomerase
MHDHLFDNQDALTEADLLEYARAVGLDLDRFQDDLAAGTFEDRIREDVRSGARSGVNGTPTFFVGGRRFDGDWNDIDAFVDALERDR